MRVEEKRSRVKERRDKISTEKLNVSFHMCTEV